jgi:hypothetical protein
VLVLNAYRHAEAIMRVQNPSCHLPWYLLAGIGQIESGQAESGRLFPDGTTRGKILGPRLDGSIAGDAVVKDTDHGVLDGDTVYDRAVGPMQFIPSTWRAWGRDGNDDGKADPNNVFDASLSAAGYLCAGGRNLRLPADLQAAIFSYNHSAPYYQAVVSWALAYRARAVAIADSQLRVITDVTKVRPKRPQAKRAAPKATTSTSTAAARHKPTATLPTSSSVRPGPLASSRSIAPPSVSDSENPSGTPPATSTSSPPQTSTSSSPPKPAPSDTSTAAATAQSEPAVVTGSVDASTGTSAATATPSTQASPTG